jgi:hypothetical protein
VEKTKTVPFNDIRCCAYLSDLSYLDQKTLRNVIIGTLPYNSDRLDVIDKYILSDPNYYIGMPLSDAQAYLWISESEHIAIVCFRGSDSLRDMADNFNIETMELLLSTPEKERITVGVHTGFYEQVKSIISPILMDLIYYQNKYDKVICTGHSSGGALATICCAIIYERLFTACTKPKIVSCITFGSPRVGDSRFVKYFNKYIKECWRITNAQDPVAIVPFCFTYQHVGYGLVIYDDKSVKRICFDQPWLNRCLMCFNSIDLTDLIGDHRCAVYCERIECLDVFNSVDDSIDNTIPV